MNLREIEDALKESDDLLVEGREFECWHRVERAHKTLYTLLLDIQIAQIPPEKEKSR